MRMLTRRRDVSPDPPSSLHMRQARVVDFIVHFGSSRRAEA